MYLFCLRACRTGVYSDVFAFADGDLVLKYFKVTFDVDDYAFICLGRFDSSSGIVSGTGPLYIPWDCLNVNEYLEVYNV